MISLSLGEQAPNFSIFTTSGEQYSFESYRKERNGWQLLVFFRGSW